MKPKSESGSSSPEALHAVVTRATHPQIREGRVVVVGDVHGCFSELDRLLQKCDYTENDLLIFVGDIVNKGPASLKVIQKAREVCALSVRGNHEQAALKHYQRWQDGQEKLSEKWQWVTGLAEEDLSYLRALPFTIALPEHNVTVVHAGLVPGVPLPDQDPGHMVEMRELVRKDSGAWKAVKQKDKNSVPWAPQWPGPSHLIFGHDARRGFQACPFATGLDTGCVYGGALTALILPPPHEAAAAASQLDADRSAGGAPEAEVRPPGEIVSVMAEAVYEMPKDGNILNTQSFCLPSIMDDDGTAVAEDDNANGNWCTIA
eukprot:CAMPEP_0118948224 /NCGR_PEP_ID=MMETSP1169-20130426/47427_1 /TAXON_ID=36882 /ORGANISM="Pyramimonas obovata, Strain CCMP722" /LENGTH=317 /DNA_ID=CAMNT_0006894601 /DNA_START=373 /DNA_END=1326 /DNA_ORIENTATION=+